QPLARKRLVVTKPTASPSEIVRAAELINSAQNPVVIAGGGCVNAGSEIVAFAQALDAPVLLTGNAKGVMPSSHELCAGNCLVFGRVQRDIEAADVVVVVGTELSDTDLYNGGRALNFAGKIVRIDIDQAQISRRMSPTVALVGDSATTLRELTAITTKRKSQTGATQAKIWREHARAKTNAKFVPWLQAIEDALPSDAIVALDSTQLAYSAHWWLPATQSRSWLAPYGFGTLGCALPMAIGASLAANPDANPSASAKTHARPVLVIAGDGGWLFTVAEMAVAKDLNSKIVVMLWDNRGYEQIRESFDDVTATPMGVDVSSHDPVAIAKGFGWATTQVETPQQLANALKNSFAANSPQFIRVVAN
ncbi:MAG: hypothetical protein EBV58_08425, partial [Actinobacteria bacterium]|nr:hypothetical protein [Actinomycetota bacterium]